MKNYGKILSVVVVFILLLTTVSLAGENTHYADALYELGLFKGTTNGYELDKTFTREEAATVLVRLMGEEKNVQKQSYNQEFTDVPEERWSFPYIMYCYNNDITKGTGEKTFSPDKTISAEEFVTLILRLLGYDNVEPESAMKEAVHRGVLNSEISNKFSLAKTISRNDMTYIIYRTLMTKTADGVVFANVLVQRSVITEDEAYEFDLYKSADDINNLIDRLLD